MQQVRGRVFPDLRKRIFVFRRVQLRISEEDELTNNSTMTHFTCFLSLFLVRMKLQKPV